jgi:aminodeoxyfutalosine synthase
MAATAADTGLIELGFEALAVRERLHPEKTVGYSTAAMLRVGPCEAGCILCAMFGEQPGTAPVPNSDDAARRAGELARSGVGELLLHGRHEPAALIEIVRAIRSAVALPIHGFTVEDFVETAPPALDETLAALAAAGLQSIFGGAWQSSEARAVHHSAAKAGLPSSAIVTTDDKIDLRKTPAELKELQARTHGNIAAMIIWAGRNSTAVDYLKTVATMRVLVPEIAHVSVTWAAAGIKTAQAALAFGADDIGYAVAGRTVKTIEGSIPTEEELRRQIREAGYHPARRNVAFSAYYR